MELDSQEPQQRGHRRLPPILYRILWRIHEQWKLLGFFEINQDHQFYEFTCMLKEGLKASVQHAIDNHAATVREVRRRSDFTRVFKQVHEGFEMRTYAGPIFAQFRQFLGMVDLDYQNSLSCEDSYLQFISNSKSSADFFLTNDKHFFLKTQRRREIRFLLAILPKYLEHMERYPHSILVKFLGVHSIIIPSEKKKYFIIMQSIFYPHERIVERYDIKGCQVNRWTAAAPEGSEVIMVFKDLNFGDQTICLDQQRAWLVRQVELDTEFLKTLHVIDYSLLVGFQPLHEDERILNRALVNIIARTTVSINESFYHHQPQPSFANERVTSLTTLFNQAISSADQFYKLSPESKDTLQTVLELYLKHRPSTEIDPDFSTRSEAFMREVLAPYILQSSSLEEVPESLGQTDNHITRGPSLADSTFCVDQNLRLLPNSRNPFHVIDGPDYRYFVGIIDFFTVYGFRKKLENFWKSIRYRNQSFSTVPPASYAQRLCRWVEEHTT